MQRAHQTVVEELNLETAWSTSLTLLSKKLFFLLLIFAALMPACSGLKTKAGTEKLIDLKQYYKKNFSGEDAAEKNLSWMDVEHISYVDKITAATKDIQSNFDEVVLFGIGGSDLGARALQWALAHGPLYNSLPDSKRNGPRFFFAGDNANPSEISNLLSIVNPEKALIIVVSKSGTTAETIGSFLSLFHKFLDTLGNEKVGSHIVAITGKEEKSILRKMDGQFHFRYVFDIENGVGGRFSVLSPVGLLPAAILGIDIEKIIEGAVAARDEALSNTSNTDLPSKITLTAITAMSEGKNIIAFFPFDGRLKVFSSWFRQLWSESLGKKLKNGKSTGSTPLALVGSTDNHSVQQLILDGPLDKLVILIGVTKTQNDIKINVLDGDAYKGISYLDGVGLAEMLRAMTNATEKTYQNRGIKYLRFDLPAVDEINIGRFIMQLEMATAWTGELLGINPFDQPAVNEGKKYVKEYLIGK